MVLEEVPVDFPLRIVEPVRLRLVLDQGALVPGRGQADTLILAAQAQQPVAIQIGVPGQRDLDELRIDIADAEGDRTRDHQETKVVHEFANTAVYEELRCAHM